MFVHSKYLLGAYFVLDTFLIRLVTLFVTADKTEVQKGESLRKQPNSHTAGISTQVNLNFL